jgi:1-acyl-sn-glycerol-3-phosphate acyltransferase
MAGLFLGLYRFFSKRKWLLFCMLAGWLVLIGWSITNLRFSEDITDLLPKDERTQSIIDGLDAAEFSDRVILHLYVDSSTTEADIFTPADSLVKWLGDLQPTLIEEGNLRIETGSINAIYDKVMADLPYLLEDSDFFYLDSISGDSALYALMQRHYNNILSPSGMFSAKYITKDPLGLGGRVLQRMNGFNLDENLQLEEGFLVTPDNRHLLLFLQPAFEANNSALNTLMADSLNQIAVRLNAQFADIQLEAFGAPLAASANATQIKKDIYFTVTLALIALLVVIFIFYRSFRVFAFILIPSAIGGATALAVFSWLNVPVSLISISIGSILLGISVDYALHVFTHFRTKGEVGDTINDLVEPVLLSSATTSVAFFCLLLLNAPALKHLGVFAGVSVLVGSVSALLFLPHLLSAKMNLPETKRNSFIDRFNSLRPDRNKWVVLGAVILSGVLYYFSGNVGFDGDLLKMNFSTEKLDKAEKNLSAISNVSLKNVLVVSSGPDWQTALLNNESVLQKSKIELQSGKVQQVASLSSFMPSAQMAEARKLRWQQLLDTGKLSNLESRISVQAEKLGLKPDAFAAFFGNAGNYNPQLDYSSWASLPLFSNFVHQDEKGFHLVTAVKLQQENRQKYLNEISQLLGVSVVDKQFITNKIIDFVRQDFDKLVRNSLIAVFLILLLAYGRIELALFTFLPMMLSWVWTLGLMHLFDLHFNIFNIILSTFIFGLGIDYSIFISRSFLQYFKYGQDELVSYKNSIFLSAFTTAVGVGVLIFAKHPALKSIAAMSLIGIGSMVFIAYTIQPLLYRWFITDRKAKGLVPVNAFGLLYGLFSLIYFFVGSLILQVVLIILQIVPANGQSKRRFFRGMMGLFLGSLTSIMINVRRELVNYENEDFKKPAVVIANHQSFIDILLMLQTSPNMVMVVKKWVYNSPVFGWAVRYAGYFYVNDGYENALPRLRKLVAEGCSIVVFPEGTRTEDGNLNRFHKGAFYLSEKLELDVVPIIFHGSDYAMPKGDSYLLKNGFVHKVILPRISFDDKSFGRTYQERHKSISRLFKSEFYRIKAEYENPDYFRDFLIRNYIFKGPVLEWYTRIKIRLENNYEVFHEHLPKSGLIVDIGCGYGYLGHILAWTGKDRQIIGFDHDAEKIAVANNTPAKPANVSFEVKNALTAELPQADAFVISDVLHYLPQEDQRKLLEKCMKNLLPGGILFVRDADASMQKRHFGTKLTEFFSTRLGFNKTNANQLCFVTREFIETTAKSNNFKVEVIDTTKLTSNLIYILKKAE